MHTQNARTTIPSHTHTHTHTHTTPTTTTITTTRPRVISLNHHRSRGRSNRYTRTTFSVEPRDQSARTATLRLATYIECERITHHRQYAKRVFKPHTIIHRAYLGPAYPSRARRSIASCVPWSRATFGCAHRRRRWTWRKSRRWFGQSSSSGDGEARRACVSSTTDGVDGRRGRGGRFDR